MLGFVIAATAAATPDLKQIDSEMQAILAELLMPGPQLAVQPQLAQMPFPSENTITSDLVDSSQPQILPPQLMQTAGLLFSSGSEYCKQHTNACTRNQTHPILTAIFHIKLS